MMINAFNNAATVALNYVEIGKKWQRISKNQLFVKKHNWKGINYRSGKNNWEKIETNNPTTALNVLHVKKVDIFLPTFQIKT